MMMVTMMQTYKMDVVPWSNKEFTYYNFVYSVLEAFNWLLHYNGKMMMMMVTMMQTYKMDVVPWSNKEFTYYNFVYSVLALNF